VVVVEEEALEEECRQILPIFLHILNVLNNITTNKHKITIELNELIENKMDLLSLVFDTQPN
jgi:hypothetical protein